MSLFMDSILRFTLVTIALIAAPAALAGPDAFYYERMPVLDGGGTDVAGMNARGEIAASSGHQFGTAQPYDTICTNRFGELEPLTNGPAAMKYYAAAINDAGQIAGKRYVYSSSPPDMLAFRYTPGVGYQELGKLSGVNGRVDAMNASGEVVGGWQTAGSYQYHAFRYKDGVGFQALPDAGAIASEAFDINDSGLIVGQISPTESTYRPVQWVDGQMQYLADWNGRALLCNNAGVIVFVRISSPGGIVVRVPGAADVALTPFGHTAITVNALSESGYVVGTWIEAGFHTHGFRYNVYTQEMLDLGFLTAYTLGTTPQVVNDRGEVAGMALDENYESTAFYFSPDAGMIDLDSFRNDSDEWRTGGAIAINNAGHILVDGWSVMQGNTSAGAVFWPIHKGDINGDREVDFADIDAFIAALGDPAAYRAAYPLGERLNADVNNDGVVDFADIDGFVALLGQ